MSRRGLTVFVTALLVMGAAPFTSFAIPDDADQDYVPDTAETVCANAGDGPIVGNPEQGRIAGACTDGQYDPSAEIAAVLASLCAEGSPMESRCESGYYGGPTSAGDIDPLWDDLQHYVIDFAFENLATTLKGAGLDLAPATDENGDVVDVDNDGSPDAWNVTNPAGEGYAWIPSDFIFGPVSNGDPMFPQTPGSLPVPGVPGDGGGGGGDGETIEAGVVVITTEGSMVWINITQDPSDPDATAATLAINASQVPPSGFRNSAVTLDLHGTVPSVNPPANMYYAPFNFNYLVLSDPNDIDGDGFVNGHEHNTGDENGRIFSNPINGRSIPGDADADGCPFSDEGRDDLNSRVDPCTILPYQLELLDIGAELGHPENKIWDTVSVNFNVTYIADTSFTLSERDIVSWRVWWTDQNNIDDAVNEVICDEETHGDLEVNGGTLQFECLWDTRDTEDTHDHLIGSSPVENYFGWLEICLAAEVDNDNCIEADGPLEFIVQNLPYFKYEAVWDAIPGDEDDDRAGRFSDEIGFVVNASHPFYEITHFEIRVCGAESFSTNGLLAQSPCGALENLGIIPVDDPRVRPEANSTWNITLDSNLFPQARAPEEAPPPRNGLEVVSETRGLMQQWEVAGVGFIVNTTHSGGLTREGHRQDTASNPYREGRVFNNQAPEISQFKVDVLDPEGPVLEFSFHYYDPDGTGTTDVKVEILHPTSGNPLTTSETCVQQPSNDIDGLLDDQTPVYWMDNPADFTCEWDAERFAEAAYPWRVLVPDADGGDDPVAALANVLADLGNQPPVLDGATFEEAMLPNPLALGETYTIKVHYSDPTHPPGEVLVTLANGTGAHDPIEETMARCPTQGDAANNVPLVADPNEVDFCVDVTLPSDSSWTFTFEASDAEGARVSFTPTPNEIDVPDVICDHCASEDDGVSQAKAVFKSGQDALAQGVPMPVNGHLLNDGASELFGPAEVDSDGDFVPDLVESFLLDFDVFTVDRDTDTAYFEDEWVIGVKVFEGGAPPEFSTLSIRISGGDDASFYSLNVCNGPEEEDCVLQDESLSLIDVATTPEGLTLVAYGADGAEALRLVIDGRNLGSTSKEFVNITAGSLNLEVMTNPLDVVRGGSGTHPGGETPTAGFRRASDGGLVGYVDPDGHDGPTAPMETGNLNPGDLVGAVDADGDSMPDAAEVVHCHTIHSLAPSLLGGRCFDRDGDGLFEDWQPS